MSDRVLFISIELKHRNQALDISGPGVMLGWKWFWTDPGDSGLNLGLLLGAGSLSGKNSTEYLDKVLLDVRVEFGYAL